METLVRDVRYGVRTLFKNRSFTVVAIVALALGIGANTAIFSVVNAVLLRPLQFEQSDRLMMVWEKRLQLGRLRNPVSPPDFNDWRAQNKVFEDMAAFSSQGFNLGTSSEPERIQGAGRIPKSVFDSPRPAPPGPVFWFRRRQSQQRPGRDHQQRTMATPLRFRSRHRRQDGEAE